MKTLSRGRQNRAASQPHPVAGPRYALEGQGGKGGRLERLEEEQGFVMIVSLILLVLFTWLGLNSLTASTMETKISDSMADNVKAFYIAEAGLERAKSILKNETTADLNNVLVGSNGQLDSSKPDTDPVNSDNGILPELGSSVSYAGGTYQVRITDNNDGDSNLGVDKDRRVIINSTGRDAQGNTRTLRAEVWGRNLTLKAAISVYNNRAEKRFDSTATSFVITGNDTTYLGGAGPGPNVHAIVSADAVSDDVYYKDGRCSSNPGPNACDKVTGKGGARDFLDTDLTSMPLSDLQSMRTSLIARADTTYTGSTTLSSGTLGTASDPKIIYVNDALDLKGTVSGAGILIVDKDLKVEGTFTWQGIILISLQPGGSGRFETVSGNVAKIYGAIVINSSSLCNEVRTDGDARIYYSSAAINMANQKSFRMLSWKEEL